MTAENIESRPIKKVNNLARAGEVFVYAGAGTFFVGGFGSSLIVAGVGGATLGVGYGLTCLADRREAAKHGKQLEMGLNRGPRGKVTQLR